MKIMLRRTALAFITMLMVGCATGYQKKGFTGGFSETQLAENVFRVAFKGNQYTSRERTADFTLLRSAEVAVENGFKYFVIVKSKERTKTRSYTGPTTAQTTGKVYENNTGTGIGGIPIPGAPAATFESTTAFSATSTTNFYFPSETNTILCFKEKPETSGIVYGAEFLIKSIKTKYKIED